MPEPPSATLWGLSAAESPKLIVPERTPADVGVNVTRTVQAPFAASEPQLLLVAVKSPVTWISLMLSVPLPVFVTVIIWAALVVPTAEAVKVRPAGLMLAIAAVEVSGPIF